MPFVACHKKVELNTIYFLFFIYCSNRKCRGPDKKFRVIILNDVLRVDQVGLQQHSSKYKQTQQYIIIHARRCVLGGPANATTNTSRAEVYNVNYYRIYAIKTTPEGQNYVRKKNITLFTGIFDTYIFFSLLPNGSGGKEDKLECCDENQYEIHYLHRRICRPPVMMPPITGSGLSKCKISIKFKINISENYSYATRAKHPHLPTCTVQILK